MKKLVHKHVLIKAYLKNPPMTVETLNQWLTELVSDIGMKICIPPRSRYVDVPGNRGVTGLVGIETSHCSCHVWDEENPGIIQMDVYSCSDFEPETVLNKLREFGLISYELMLIDRNDGFKLLSHVVVEEKNDH